MDLPAVITQLRSFVPLLGNRVAGAASLEVALDQGAMDLPAAYVVPLDEEAEDRGDMTGLNQVVTERVGVIIIFDNRPDADGRRGQTVTELWEPLRRSLLAALLNWPLARSYDESPPGLMRAMLYGGGAVARHDRACFAYQFDFYAEFLITDDDGWQPDRVPLTAIDVRTSNPPADEFLVQLPQE